MARRIAVFAVLALASSPAWAKKKKKKKKGDAPPPTGWYQDAEADPAWFGACYYPPDFEKLNTTDRKMARANALDEMITQWGGQRDDGISFNETHIEDLETVLLGRPDRIEEVAVQNRDHCVAWASKGAGMDAWASWLRAQPKALTVGECPSPPLDYTMFDYLDIGNGWQRPLPMCKDDHVRISGTASDRYRISKDSPWINVAGDTNVPATGGDFPCNIEGCYAGTLIARFVGESGVELIFPVGESTNFRAPEHGTISYRINDESFYDNTWFQNGSLIDHTAIEVSPVGGLQ